MIEVNLSHHEVAFLLLFLVVASLGVLGVIAIAAWRTGEPATVIETPRGPAVLLLETDARRASSVTMPS